MTGADRVTLDLLTIRLRHVAATACLLSDHHEVEKSSYGLAVAGIADNLRDLVDRLEVMIAQSVDA